MSLSDTVPLSKEVLDEAEHFLLQEEKQFYKKIEKSEHSLYLDSKVQGYNIVKEIINFCQDHLDQLIKIDSSDQVQSKQSDIEHSLYLRGCHGPPTLTPENVFTNDDNGVDIENLRKEKERLDAQLSDAHRQLQQSMTISKELHKLYTDVSKKLMLIQTKYSSNSNSPQSFSQPAQIADSGKCSEIASCYRELTLTHGTRAKDSFVKPPSISLIIWRAFIDVLMGTVLKISFTQVRRIRRQMASTIIPYLQHPVCSTKGCLSGHQNHPDYIKSRTNSEDTWLLGNVDQLIRQCMLSHADKVTNDCLVQDVVGTTLAEVMSKLCESTMNDSLSSVQRDQLYQTFQGDFVGSNGARLGSFIKLSCEFCWKMVAQQSEMSLKVPMSGEKYGNIAEEFEAIIPSGRPVPSQGTVCDQAGRPVPAHGTVRDQVVEYALEPCLMHSDDVLQKGRVMVTCPL